MLELAILAFHSTGDQGRFDGNSDITFWRNKMIKAIKFCSIPVADQDRALDCYTSKLGFVVATDQEMGPQRWIELGIPGATQGFGR